MEPDENRGPGEETKISNREIYEDFLSSLYQSLFRLPDHSHPGI
jgi:hypothetical protein